MAAWSGGLGQQQCERLDPLVDSDMVDIDPALGEQFLQVAVRHPEAEVPADCQDDHLGWEAETGEGGSWRGAGRGRVLMTPVSVPDDGHGACNSAV